MLIWTMIKVALKTLISNKLRSFLAMLGIIIGVGAVISMLGLGAGAKKQVIQKITAMGTNLLIVRPGGERRGGVRSGSSETLVIGDAAAIIDHIEGAEIVSPLVRGRAQVKYYNENANTTIAGAAQTYLDIRNFEIETGRVFTSFEEERSSRVAILGASIAEQLFGTRDSLDERFRIKNVNFHIIGVLKAKGDQGWFNPDDMVIIPYSTAMKQILGRTYLDEIDVKAGDGEDLSRIEADMEQLLRRRHNIREGDDADFHIRNQAEIIEMASDFTRTFTILLGGIAGISLIVGGIGIMNIMLVTVTERTREIGVRKAIGARDRDILRQFLLESILISGVGGIIGIGIGYVTADIIQRFSDFQTVIEPASIVPAICVSATVGVFFGYYPARRAARLNPIEALRYE